MRRRTPSKVASCSLKQFPSHDINVECNGKSGMYSACYACGRFAAAVQMWPAIDDFGSALMPQIIPPKQFFLSTLLTAGVLAFATALPAQVVLTHGPQIGSSNPITADPPVERPHTQPCTVQLFTNEQFADFNVKSFDYAPPSKCHGPWAKGVFSADFTVTAGRQFDRTAQFLIS